MEIPPWLQITPSSYLQAMEAGSQIGLRRQQLAQQVAEEQQRNQMASREFAQRQIESQQAGQERAAALDLQRNRLSFNDANQRNQDDAANALKIEQMQQDAMQFGVNTDLKTAQLGQEGDLAQQRIDTEASPFNQKNIIHNQNGIFRANPDGTLETLFKPNPKPQFQTETTVIPKTDAVDAKPADVTTHWLHNLMPWGKNLQPTTNSPAVDAIPAMPERRITRRIPVGEDGETPAAAALTKPSTNSLPEVKFKGTVIKDKSTGKQFVYHGDPADIPADQYDIVQ